MKVQFIKLARLNPWKHKIVESQRAPHISKGTGDLKQNGTHEKILFLPQFFMLLRMLSWFLLFLVLETTH